MRRRFVLIVLSLISVLSVVSAQEQNEEYSYKKSKHAVGFGAGYSTGIGITYRHSFNKFGVQLAGFPYVSDNHTSYNLGLTFLYNFIQTDKSIFFLYQGNRFYYDDSDDVYFIGNATEIIYYNSQSIERELVNSLGLGYEFLVYDRIGLSFMGGYAFSAKDYDSNSLSFTGEFSALYHF